MGRSAVAGDVDSLCHALEAAECLEARGTAVAEVEQRVLRRRIGAPLVALLLMPLPPSNRRTNPSSAFISGAASASSCRQSLWHRNRVADNGVGTSSQRRAAARALLHAPHCVGGNLSREILERAIATTG